MRYLSLLIGMALLFAQPVFAEAKKFTIIHTNDMHSHLLGAAPELEYTWDKTGDDNTRGGWARIATVIKDVKSKRSNPALVIDAGDFTMGTLFHMLAREESIELRLMKEMGFDLATLGNHEFDLTPKGLARIVTTAARAGMPELVFASAIFNKESDKDDTLEEVFRKGLMKPYTVKTINGVKVGFFGIIGNDAAEVAPFASPVKFKNYIEVSREIVKILREKELVDMIVCISHAGLSMYGPGEKAKSEDEILAKEVKGIDVIVSGHTHTDLPKPIVVGKTIIVQAWENGRHVGVLDFAWEGGAAKLSDYKTIEVDDTILGDAAIQKKIDGFIKEIDARILREHGLSFWKIIANTNFDLNIREEESTLGNLVADSERWYANRFVYDPRDPSSKVVLAVESNGLIRTDLLKGKTGKLAVTDIFNTLPLGIGMDDTMSYPLITIYLYASEIKKACEVLTSVYPLKGSDYFLQISGIKFTYNPRRMLFDRVTDIWIGSEEEGYVPLDYSASNKKLYRLVANIYNSTFLKVIGNFTFGILTIVPKDKNGNPVKELKDCRIDADKNKPGIQELKEWVGLMKYIQSFKDTNGDGLSDIPDKYKAPLGRIVREPSLSPVKLLSRGTFVTWIGFAVFCVIVLILVVVIRFVVRKIKK